MGIQKKYTKNRGVCRVTFDVPETVSDNVQKVYVVGEFNNWSTSATPMKRQKNGAFKATLDLENGHAYQFRYLLNNEQWENDPEADEFAATPFADARNSVVKT